MLWIHPWGLVLSVHAVLGDRESRWPSWIAAARTRMEPPMYRMVVPMPPVEWGQKASPLGVRSHALGRKVDFGENACVFAERRMRSFS